MSYNGKSEFSKIELIIKDAVRTYEIPENIEFLSLSEKDRRKITRMVTSECKNT